VINLRVLAQALLARLVEAGNGDERLLSHAPERYARRDGAQALDALAASRACQPLDRTAAIGPNDLSLSAQLKSSLKR
jgi:hypothetical protein